MTEKTPLKKIWNTNAFFLAFLGAFFFCFLTGAFLNHPVRKEVITEKSWYFINRGYPVSWSGVSKPDLSVDYPIIKAPFLTQKVEGTNYIKIIDLSVLIPLFLAVWFLYYLILLFIFNRKKENRSPYALIIVYSLVILVCILIYFKIFPRV